jgi:hypothetical protein
MRKKVASIITIDDEVILSLWLKTLPHRIGLLEKKKLRHSVQQGKKRILWTEEGGFRIWKIR